MTSLAALVFGSSLLAMTGGPSAPSDDQAAVDEPAPPPPTRAEARRARQRQAAMNGFFGVSLEIGSTLFHVLSGLWLIGTDVRMSSAGCDAPDKPCSGPPFLILIPAGATTMGWFAATRLAESREADLRDSWVYWVGSAVEVSAIGVALAGSGKKSRSARLALDTTCVSMAALGTVLQAVGAFTGPTRAQVEALAARSPRVVPGCAPTSGGFVCGITLAGF